MVIEYSLVSWRWGGFEEVGLGRDVVLVDSGSVGRKWMQMRGLSQAVGPQDASVIGRDGRDGRDSDVVPCLARRSRCRVFSSPVLAARRSLTSDQGWITDE